MKKINHNHAKETAMAKAWQKAAIELEIEFISPFTLKSSNSKEYMVAGFLPDLGGPKGAIIISRFDYEDEDDDKVDEIIEKAGYFFSGLNPTYYENYDKDLFMETLNDWGYFGPMDKIPKWFTGGIKKHGG